MKWAPLNEWTYTNGTHNITYANSPVPLPYGLHQVNCKPAKTLGHYPTGKLARAAADGLTAASLADTAKNTNTNQGA